MSALNWEAHRTERALSERMRRRVGVGPVQGAPVEDSHSVAKNEPK